MDEPLWFGHHFTGANSCQDTIQAVAQQVAENVKALREVFPNIRIGDIEPVSSYGTPSDWPAQILEFADAYRAVTGTPLDFFHADVDWRRDWRRALDDLTPRLREAGIRFGIIYDADPEDIDDIRWTKHAEARFESVEAYEALRPDDAILQSWMLHPTHMLPEDQPGTMTNLVLRYARAQPHLSLVHDTQGLSGRLTAQDGAPMAGMPIELSTSELSAGAHPTPRTIGGIVPSLAAFGVAALRVNKECGCEGGAGNLAFGTPVYRDAGGSVASQGMGGEGAIQQRRIESGQPFSMTGKPFAVSPGADFVMQLPLDASASLAHAGYAAVIFLDARKKEIKRLTVNLEPSELPLGEVRTDASGAFALPLAATALAATYRAYFPGNDTVRAVTADAR
jgi:hypothetical protein